jgi:integrase
MAAKKFENDRRNGSAAPHDASPEVAAGAREPEPTAANRAIDAAPDAADAAARLPTHLRNLAETARDYAKASNSDNTRKAYGSDWRHSAGWARRHSLPALPPDPQILGLYIAACASGAMTGKPDSVATLERRISALRWNFAQRGEKFERADRHVATVLAGVRRTQGRPPEQKEAILPEDLRAMIATLDLRDLRGLRDRAILLIGFAGGLRRSEIVRLDRGARQTRDGTGWTDILDDGVLVTLRGKTGWREVEIGRGSSDLSCPVVALEAWLKFARIANGPLFRRARAATARRSAPNGWPTSTSPAGQTHRARRRGAWRSVGRRTGAEILRPFAARRPRLLRRDRRTLGAETARPRLRGNDPPLPAPPRPVLGQSHQGGGVVARDEMPQSIGALPRGVLRRAVLSDAEGRAGGCAGHAADPDGAGAGGDRGQLGGGRRFGVRAQSPRPALGSAARTGAPSGRPGPPRYASVEPENRLVARTLERDWETALSEQARLLADHERFLRERPQAPSPVELGAIQDLTRDLPALWRAETTTRQERQTIARLLLERVIVTVIGGSEQVRPSQGLTD